MSDSDSRLVLSMSTTIPLQGRMTVKDLIEVLEMVPDKNAVVTGNHTEGDRYAYGSTYRLELAWNKVIGNE